MELEWDDEKERKNLRKHGLDFSIAEVVLSDPYAMTLYDRHENAEHRWHTIGAVNAGHMVLVVIHTDPEPEGGAPVRIIGVRKATLHERRRYEEATDL